MRICGDSLVLAGEAPGFLCYDGIQPGSLQLRSRYEADMEGCLVYTEGRDYRVDYALGQIWRIAGSRIPDYTANILYGVKRFDHTKYLSYGNHDYFVWADYDAPHAQPFARPNSQAYLLPRTVERLNQGGPFKIIAYGDSITAGGEATEVRLRYQERWAAELAKFYPRAQLLSENGATGGDASFQGVDRLEDKVLTRQPDLVLIAFGMNDLRTPREVFIGNMRRMIDQIRARTPAEILLVSTFPPNPDWVYASGNSDEIAEATEWIARDTRCAYADVHAVWTQVLKRKDLPSLLGNNINHPNNFGHWLYLQALLAAFPG